MAFPHRSILLAGSLLVASLGVLAQAPSDADCLTCHADEALADAKRPLPGPVVSAALEQEKLSLHVTAESLKGSIHEGLSCADCHSGIREVPHSADLPDVDCATCHSDAAQELAGGIHAPRTGTAEFVPRCYSCHGAHQIRPNSDPASPTHPTRLPDTCGACHGNHDVMRAAGVRMPDPTQNFMRSDHYKALSGSEGVKTATCSDCHGTHKTLPSRDPQSPVHKTNIPATCGKCHGSIRDQYVRSIHGKALAAGDLEAPSCADCHGEHDIESADRPTSTVFAATIGKTTCPQCHASVRLSRRFNLPAHMVRSYQASFHGLATSYGETNVANCASCHGSHDILPSSDPASSINANHLAATCGKCHPGAGEAFSRISIHQQVSEAEEPVLYWIRTLYFLLIAATLGGLLLHNGLDYVRRYREAIRLLKPVSVYVRMTLADRIQHWLLLSTFFLLVITGFALKYPDSFWAVPFKLMPGGFTWRGWLHRAAAVVMVGAGLYHLAYLVVSKRGRRFFLEMLPTLQDVREVFQQLGYYLGLRRTGAEFGRFSYAEKLEYLALIWGTVIMAGTGFVLWFKTFFSRFLPEWGYPAAEMIHFYEAVLAFATIIIWHLYMVFSHTERPPYNQTWLTGRITRHDMEHHHPRELAVLEVEKGDETSTALVEVGESTQERPGPSGAEDTPDHD